MADISDTFSALGGRKVMGRQIGTWTQLHEAAKTGFPVAALRNAASLVEADARALRDLIHRFVSPATLKRHRDRLRPEISDRVARFARVAGHATAVFGQSCGGSLCVYLRPRNGRDL